MIYKIYFLSLWWSTKFIFYLNGDPQDLILFSQWSLQILFFTYMVMSKIYLHYVVIQKIFFLIYEVIHKIYFYFYGFSIRFFIYLDSDPQDLFLFIWWVTRINFISTVISKIYFYWYGDPRDSSLFL